MADKKITVKQTRSGIGHTGRQKATLKALGLGKIGRTAEHKNEPSVQGMIRAVSHLVEVTQAGK
jgi:large subunit ribosomal protein L30